MIEPGERNLLERSLRAALDRHTGARLDQELLRLDWYQALRTEPPTAIAVLFELQGLLNATSSLDPVLASVLCPEDLTRAIVLPAFGSSDPPAEQRDGAVAVRGVGGWKMAAATRVLIAVRTAAGARLLDVPTAELDLRPARGLDPALGLGEVNGTLQGATPDAPIRSDAWQQATSRARLALAHQLIGVSRRMLGLARDHAVERVQFGRPVASFQAVRHRLADCLVAIEAAEATVDAAWEVGSARSASVAKAAAGRSALAVSRHAQQVLAGMGFTAEHPLHRFVKRALALDQLLGSSASLTRSVGAELISARTLPPAVPL